MSYAAYKRSPIRKRIKGVKRKDQALLFYMLVLSVPCDDCDAPAGHPCDTAVDDRPRLCPRYHGTRGAAVSPDGVDPEWDMMEK
jgi:hypothetical protein